MTILVIKVYNIFLLPNSRCALASNFQTSCAYLIHDTAQAFRRRFGREIASLGFNQTHWRILGFLSRTGPLGQSQIADLLVLHKVPVGTALNELERDGWIVRTPMQQDRRAREVSLTARSEPAIATLKIEFDALEAALLARLSSDAAETFPLALRKVRDALRGESPENIDVKEETPLWLLVDCARHLMRRLDARLEELGVTRSQWFVLNALYHDGGQTQVDLARQLDMSAALLGKQLDQLEKTDWIERRQDPEDRRVRRLDISSEQRPAIAEIRRLFDHSHNTLFDVLDAATRNELARSLESFGAYLKEERA
jgi:DNA-binding MarR family transcriptional regulator